MATSAVALPEKKERTINARKKHRKQVGQMTERIQRKEPVPLKGIWRLKELLKLQWPLQLEDNRLSEDLECLEELELQRTRHEDIIQLEKNYRKQLEQMTERIRRKEPVPIDEIRQLKKLLEIQWPRQDEYNQLLEEVEWLEELELERIRYEKTVQMEEMRWLEDHKRIREIQRLDETRGLEEDRHAQEQKRLQQLQQLKHSKQPQQISLSPPQPPLLHPVISSHHAVAAIPRRNILASLPLIEPAFLLVISFTLMLLLRQRLRHGSSAFDRRFYIMLGKRKFGEALRRHDLILFTRSLLVFFGSLVCGLFAIISLAQPRIPRTRGDVSSFVPFIVSLLPLGLFLVLFGPEIVRGCWYCICLGKRKITTPLREIASIKNQTETLGTELNRQITRLRHYQLQIDLLIRKTDASEARYQKLDTTIARICSQLLALSKRFSDMTTQRINAMLNVEQRFEDIYVHYHDQKRMMTSLQIDIMNLQRRKEWMVGFSKRERLEQHKQDVTSKQPEEKTINVPVVEETATPLEEQISIHERYMTDSLCAMEKRLTAQQAVLDSNGEKMQYLYALTAKTAADIPCQILNAAEIKGLLEKKFKTVVIQSKNKFDIYEARITALEKDVYKSVQQTLPVEDRLGNLEYDVGNTVCQLKDLTLQTSDTVDSVSVLRDRVDNLRLEVKNVIKRAAEATDHEALASMSRDIEILHGRIEKLDEHEKKTPIPADGEHGMTAHLPATIRNQGRPPFNEQETTSVAEIEQYEEGIERRLTTLEDNFRSANACQTAFITDIPTDNSAGSLEVRAALSAPNILLECKSVVRALQASVTGLQDMLLETNSGVVLHENRVRELLDGTEARLQAQLEAISLGQTATQTDVHHLQVSVRNLNSRMGRLQRPFVGKT